MPERLSAVIRSKTLGLILVVSCTVRVSTALAFGDQVQPLPGTFDQVSYDALAWRVANGHGFSFATDSWPMTAAGAPTAHWSFLFTILLSTVYTIFGHAPLIARLIHAMATGLLVPWLTYSLSNRLFERRTSLIAAALSAGYLYFVYYSATLMTEMLTIALILGWLMVALLIAEQGTTRRWIVFGVLVGLTALMRQVAVIPVPVVTVWLLWRAYRDGANDPDSNRSGFRRALGGAALAAIIAAALILPATVRNVRAFGRLVPINTNAGFAFYWANHPVHGTDFKAILGPDDPSYQELIPPELRQLDEAALNDVLMARGWRFILDEPLRIARLSLSRIPDYFLFWPSSASSRVSNVSRVLSFGIMWPFMVAGLWIARARWRRSMPLLMFASIYTLIHLASWSLIRYRLPVDAVLMVFAAVGVEWTLDRSPVRLPKGSDER